MSGHRPAPQAAPTEGKRALIATALGVALGIVVAIFSRGEGARRRAWRDRSAT